MLSPKRFGIRQPRPKNGNGWWCLPQPALAAGLAKRYFSKELGDLAVQNQDGVTTFDFGEWKSTAAPRKNDDGTVSFITIDPTDDGFEFVVGERSGRWVLIIRDGQHEYVFTEAA